MVRSKSETDDLLKLAPKVRAADKYCPASLQEIEQSLSATGGKTELRWRMTIIDDGGTEREVTLRLNLNCKSSSPAGWTASLKIGKAARIDCIDFEGGIGWHRHEFSEQLQSAERQKSSIEGFHNAMTQAEFLVRSLKLMGIRCNRHSDGILPFDQGSADGVF